MFLSKCKKINIVPNGLKLNNNPFNSQSTSVKNKGHNICVKAEKRLRNAAINDAYQKQRDLQHDIRAYIQTLKSSSPTNYQQITEFCESQYRRYKKEVFQRKSKNFFQLCDNHPVLDSAAQFLHKTDNASLSAIHSNVANFSKLKLSQTHHDLLNLGLSFCPTPRHINPVKVCYDNEQFCRRLRLQEYFSNRKKENCSSTSNNKTKEWTPPDGRNQFIDSFVNRARTYYDNFVSSISHDTRSNLPNNQQSALKDLSSNNDIVIKEADKGGAITIINKEDYITDCNTLLEDNSTYHKTTTDMMQTHLNEAKNLLNNITVDNKQVVSQLLPAQPRPGLFYALPKLHKLKPLISSKYNNSHLINTLTNTEQITQVANSLEIRPPYRPIVSCKGTLTEHISEHVDSI